MNTTIGMIGIGLMGHGIAINLLRKGFALNYLQHPGNQPTADLDALGAKAFTDRGALASASDTIILCVSGSPEVEAVLRGEDGVLATAKPGTAIVDCSTAIPSSTERLAQEAAAKGLRYLDAAMTRTPVEAEQGRLNLLIGGEKALYDELEPMLAAFSENRFYAGGPGAGHTLKLLHNYVSLGFVTLLAEAANSASKAGIAPATFVDVLQKGGGGGVALDRLSPFIVDGDASKLKFSVANALKDLTYYTAMAKDLNSADATATGVHATLKALADAGFAQELIAKAPALLGDLKR